MIDVIGLGHTFERWGHRVRALDQVSLTIARGEWLMLIGPNGSGKSTLLKLLVGELPVQDGIVKIDGQPIDKRSTHLWRKVFLVHQDPTAGTAPALTVSEHLLLSDTKLPSERRKRYATTRSQTALLEAFGLDAGLNQQVYTLSGGQRQLLCLIIAKLRPGPIILLDEPIAALDPERAAQCERALRSLHADGKTIVMVTHDLEFAASRGDRTVGLRHGRIVYDERGNARLLKSFQAPEQMPLR